MIQEKDFDTNKTKETIIDVVDGKQLIGSVFQGTTIETPNTIVRKLSTELSRSNVNKLCPLTTYS